MRRWRLRAPTGYNIRDDERRFCSAPAPGPGGTRFLLTLGLVRGLFGLMRLGWVEDNLLTPLAQIQQQVADQLTGAHTDLLVFNASCSGGDPMALCAGPSWPIPPPGARACAAAALGCTSRPSSS